MIVISSLSVKKIRQLFQRSDREIVSYHFGKCEYFPKSKTLMRDGQEAPISSTPAKFLMCLLESDGELIHRTRIIETVWDEGTSDNSYYNNLRRLKQQLGDSDSEAHIEKSATPGMYRIKPDITIRYKSSIRDYFHFAKLTLVALALLSIITLLTFSVLNRFALDKYKSTDYRIITTEKGSKKRAAMLPDSQIIAYMHKKAGSENWVLLAKNIESDEVKLLDTQQPHYVSEPSFSPSGNQLAWVRTNYHTYCDFYVADFDKENLSISNARPVLSCLIPDFGRTPQWKTENILIVAMRATKENPSGIIEFNIDLNKKTLVIVPAGTGTGDFGLAYNNQNNKIAHLRLTNENGGELLVYDYKTKKDVLLKRYVRPPYAIAWVGTEGIIAKNDQGFEIVQLNGKTIPVVSEQLGDESYPFYAGKNTVGFVRGATGVMDVVKKNIKNGTYDYGFASYAHDYKPVIAKDSGDIAFVSTSQGVRQIFVTDKDGIPGRVTNFIKNQYLQDIAISPDGNYIAFVSDRKLTLITRSGKIVYQKNFAINGLTFNNSSQYLYFGSETKSGTNILKLSLEEPQIETVTPGFMPKFAENGVLYYFDFVHGVKAAVLHAFKDGEIYQLFVTPLKVSSSNTFDISKGYLYYVTTSNNQLTLVKEDINTRETIPVTPITSRHFSLNRDGSMLVTSKAKAIQNNLATFRLVRLSQE